MANVSLECPCCGTKLVVDAATGDILSEDRPQQKSTRTFEDAVHEMRQGSKRREDAFSKAFDQTQRMEDILDKKFREAQKKADKDKDTPPRTPFDLD